LVRRPLLIEQGLRRVSAQQVLALARPEKR
jgi:hypothetical protein